MQTPFFVIVIKSFHHNDLDLQNSLMVLISKLSARYDNLVCPNFFSDFVIESFFHTCIFVNPFQKQSVFPTITFPNMGCKNLSDEPNMVSNLYVLDNFAFNAQRAFLDKRCTDPARWNRC